MTIKAVKDHENKVTDSPAFEDVRQKNVPVDLDIKYPSDHQMCPSDGQMPWSSSSGKSRQNGLHSATYSNSFAESEC